MIHSQLDLIHISDRSQPIGKISSTRDTVNLCSHFIYCKCKRNTFHHAVKRQRLKKNNDGRKDEIFILRFCSQQKRSKENYKIISVWWQLSSVVKRIYTKSLQKDLWMYVWHGNSLRTLYTCVTLYKSKFPRVCWGLENFLQRQSNERNTYFWHICWTDREDLATSLKSMEAYFQIL